MDFSSDTAANVCPEILQAIIDCNKEKFAGSYGEHDHFTEAAQTAVRRAFQKEDLAIFPVSSGTAANCLALAHICPPWGTVVCTRTAHIQTDECGAPHFFGDGLSLYVFPEKSCSHGKMESDDLEKCLAASAKHTCQHHSPFKVLSLTQATEAGTCYTLAETDALAETAHRYDLLVHMDGARLFNAVAKLGCSLADATWRAGVDVLSLGLSKNGAMFAELIIFFQSGLAVDMPYRRKRAGHLQSKSRYLAVQATTMLSNDLWLKNAGHANMLAKKLVQGLEQLGIKILHPVEVNEIFCSIPLYVETALRESGVHFYRWVTPAAEDLSDMITVRFVTTFTSTEQDISKLLGLCQLSLKKRPPEILTAQREIHQLGI